MCHVRLTAGDADDITENKQVRPAGRARIGLGFGCWCGKLVQGTNKCDLHAAPESSACISDIFGIARCRANMAHVGQSRPDSGLGFEINVLKMLLVVDLGVSAPQ